MQTPAGLLRRILRRRQNLGQVRLQHIPESQILPDYPTAVFAPFFRVVVNAAGTMDGYLAPFYTARPLAYGFPGKPFILVKIDYGGFYGRLMLLQLVKYALVPVPAIGSPFLYYELNGGRFIPDSSIPQQVAL